MVPSSISYSTIRHRKSPNGKAKLVWIISKSIMPTAEHIWICYIPLLGWISTYWQVETVNTSGAAKISWHDIRSTTKSPPSNKAAAGKAKDGVVQCVWVSITNLPTRINYQLLIIWAEATLPPRAKRRQFINRRTRRIRLSVTAPPPTEGGISFIMLASSTTGIRIFR